MWLSWPPLCFTIIFHEVEMSDAIIAQKAPIGVDVTEGKTYYWCACGRSNKQPFCDGSHKDTDFTPLEYTADKTAKIFFCACKQSDNKPKCDGTHSTL